MRLVFLGSPEEAVVALDALHEAGHEIPLVVTQPDRRRSRGGGLDPSPVKRRALELDLPVVTPERCRDVLDDIMGAGAELGVVVAFGQLIPTPVLEAVPHGYVNVHFSLLPRWRGAAPVERAILAGDDETGVCLMQLEAGLDTGPVYARERIPITAADTAGDLRARLAEIGARMLVENLDAIPHTKPVPQEGEATYAHKLTVEEFGLDWSRPASELARVVRAASPKPGAWTTAGGRRLKILRASALPGEAQPGLAPGAIAGPASVVTGEGLLVLEEVQPETKPIMAGAAWAAGFRGDHLGGE